MTNNNTRCLDLSQSYASVHKKELNELIDCYEQHLCCCAGNNNGHQADVLVAVIIESASGTGKTVLMDRFCSYVQQQQQNNNMGAAYVCRGKFEERAAASEPFAAIVEAVNQLLHQLFETTDVLEDVSSSRRQLWQKRLKDGLGTEIASLEIMFPKMAEIFATNKSLKDASSGDLDMISSIHSTSSSSSSSSKEEVDSFGNLEEKEWRFERFRFAFRSFLRIVSTHVPLVFLLDALHWADPDSLQLIHTLLNDSKSTNRRFMFVAASRPIIHYPPLQAALADFDQHPAEPRFIRLENLNTIGIACLLEDLLERNNIQPVQQEEESESKGGNDIMALAETIYQKTGGNPFVVVQLLRILENKKLLRYPMEESSTKWEWNLEGIRSESSIVSDNVTQVLAGCCLESIDIRQRHALTTAAMFGVSCFEVTTIVHAMTLLQEKNLDASVAEKETAPCLLEQQGHENSSKSSFLDGNCSVDDDLDPLEVINKVRLMNSLLREAARNGFVVEMAPGRFKFAHDRIREAAYTLLPDHGPHAKQMLHLRIGRQLRSWTEQSSELGISSAFTEESLLFHATKQLNLGASLMEDAWEKLDLAEQNFLCAEMAARKTSFFLAAEYLEQGLKHLGDQPWQDHYALTHKLSVALTRILHSCGKFRDSLSAADKILKHGKVFQHKRLVYHIKFLCLLQQGNLDEAQDLILGVLNELGLYLPRRFLRFRAVIGIRKVARLLNAMSDEDILNLPEVEEEEVHDLAAFLIRLMEIALKGGEPLYLAIGTINLVQSMLQHGKCSVSVIGLIGYAVFQAQLGNVSSFSRFMRLGMSLADRGKSKHDTRARVAFWTTASAVKCPMREGIAPLQAAIKEYWKYGALEHVFQDMHVIFRLMFACGEPLSDLVREFENAAESLLDYKQHVHWNVNAPLFQAVESLMGKTEDPVVLIGKYIKQEDHENMEMMRNARVQDQYCFFSMTLAYYFHSYELAEEKIARLQPLRKSLIGSQLLLRVFYSGLVFVARYRETAKRKYKRMTRVQYRQLRRWADDGAVSCIHMHQLLHAEELSTSSPSTAACSDIDNVRREYDRAIESATSLGFRNHMALANELAGVYLTTCNDEPRKATLYLSRAVDLYREWGAEAKVKDLHARYGMETFTY